MILNFEISYQFLCQIKYRARELEEQLKQQLWDNFWSISLWGYWRTKFLNIFCKMYAVPGEGGGAGILLTRILGGGVSLDPHQLTSVLNEKCLNFDTLFLKRVRLVNHEKRTSKLSQANYHSGKNCWNPVLKTVCKYCYFLIPVLEKIFRDLYTLF